mmetsp:Transcript_17498/g.38618  ORF Transcript_17498/g.38618 Transcript_17498/m.38618 type:complete len:85 (+) Transcript_17498:250-504(+)
MSLTQDETRKPATPDTEKNKNFSVTGSISARLGNEDVLAEKPPPVPQKELDRPTKSHRIMQQGAARRVLAMAFSKCNFITSTMA